MLVFKNKEKLIGYWKQGKYVGRVI